MSEIYDLRMALDRIRPEIWRRLEVPADLSLAGLSRAIQRAFGWNGGHLWRFERRGREWGVPNEHDLTDPPADARTTSVGDALGDGVGRLDYVYDFGDHWEVTVEVEDRFAPESSVDSPRLLDGERAGPPDDCGGPPGYQQLVEGLETGDLPDFHQRWEDWDPEAFDADERELPSVETLEERARVDAARLGALSVEEVSERATSSGASIDDPADVSSGELAEAIIDPKADVDLGGLVETLEEIEATEVDDLGDLAEISFEVDDLGEELEEAREEVAATAQSQSGDRIVPPPGEKLRTFPTSMAVRDCLSRLSVGQLDRIFDNLGFDERPSRREQRANLIADRLEDSDGVAELLDECSRAELEILAFLSAYHTDVPVRDLVEEELVGEDDDWLRFDSDSPLGRLRRVGLVHVGLHQRRGVDYVFAGTPLELQDSVRDWFEQSEEWAVESVGTIVDDLLREPPLDEVELRQRCGAFDPATVQEELMRRIAAGEIDEETLPACVELAHLIGLKGWDYRLEQIIADPTPDASDERWRARLAAFAVWSLDAPDDPFELADYLSISADQVRELSEATMSVLMGGRDRTPELSRVPAEQLLEAEPEERELLFDRTEEMRRESGADAGLFYGPLLADETYRELWPLFVEPVREEGHPADAWLLERCARRSQGDEAARFRRAAMELRSRETDDGEETGPEGVGLLGTCDGQGVFPVGVRLEGDDDSGGFVNALLRADDFALRDGFAIPGISDAEFEDLVAQIEASGDCKLTPVPLEVVGGLAERAVGAYRERDEFVPLDLVEPVQRLLRLPERPLEPVEADFEGELAADDLAALLNRPVFDSWVFDLWELYEADLAPLPDSSEVDDRWIDRAASALADIPDAAARRASMCRQMARWSQYSDSANTAGLFAHLAETVEEDFEGSPLTRKMIADTVEFYAGRPEFGELVPCESPTAPTLRQQVEQRLGGPGGDVDPTVSERHLELMTLVFEILDFVRPAIPRDDQPRFEEMLDVAVDLGMRLGDLRPESERSLRRIVDDVLGDLDWPEARADIVYPEVVTNLAADLGMEVEA